MLIGLLEAETLPPKVVAEFGSYGNMFEHLLANYRPDWTFKYFAAEQGHLPQSIQDCDAYTITGSRHNAYDNDPWITNLKEFVRALDKAKKPCLGICFGHQLVAEALGGKAEHSSKGWGIGAADFQVCGSPPWMTELPTSFTILVSHQDQVILLPPHAHLLAQSDFCPLGGFFVEDHILCLQGHPEFTAPYLEQLLYKRKSIIGAEDTDKALISLKKNVSQEAVSRLICLFFEQSRKQPEERI
jgi:GMP synthase-like glutamine amidotransferase